MSSFAESSRNVEIETRGSETWLVCEAQREDGSWQPAQINLDDVIGNDDGWFSRETTGFTQSAENIDLHFRDENEPWLVADLPMRDGGYRGQQGINLGLHITNIDGNLEWYGQ
ncbi:CVNH domain protein [Aspergillus parasiticus SU-1]|uniref:Cyanovirin-N n=2 Tax=Aspergillus parasiticus TaxID=5067 RepID=A0A5N6DXN9_ASPPA|nr:Cyanovirin-N [Aspergillus parasiticus]KJK64189.1 CVNH domain protein [Aspergillus parasiticus SU-1]